MRVRGCQAEGVACAKAQRGNVSAAVHGLDGVAGERWQEGGEERWSVR